MLKTIETDKLEAVHGGYSAQLFGAMQQAVGMGLTVNSTVTGGHATHSFHYLGRAFDAVGTPGQMNAYFNYEASHAKPAELIHGNRFLKNGHAVAPIGGHDNHVHTAF